MAGGAYSSATVKPDSVRLSTQPSGASPLVEEPWAFAERVER